MNPILKTGVALSLAAFSFVGVLQPVAAQEPAAPQAAAQVEKPFLHSLFTDNMVLQRGIAAPVWGWAKPGERVFVILSKGTEETMSQVVAGADGKWMARLGPLGAGGPYRLQALSRQKSVTLRNVMVGDVWICSGQSNMEMGVGAIDAPAEIAAANNSNIRLFSVPKTVAFSPRELTAGQWDVCTPETVARGGWGGFSAVAYFFGKNLQPSANVPIGLIHSSWSGTIAEAWTSADALKVMPEFVPAINQVEAQAKNANAQDVAQLLATWWQKNDPGTVANWQSAAFDAMGWKTMALPANWETAALPAFDGVVWFRREVTIPQSWAGKELTLHLGAIDDGDTTFFNGVAVGATQGWQTPRSYKISANEAKAGRNVVAVRVLDTGGGGGFHGAADAMKLEGPNGETISLAGDWLFKDSVALAQASPVPSQLNSNPHVSTVLYNGMIAPLVPFGIKGAIWYQGESNVGRAKQYQTLLPTMIGDWRNRFGVGAFPFLIVQLANFRAAHDVPTESAWAELRESQARVAQTLPGTGLAVTIDIGEANDIHPKNKQEVGRRLALAAQAMAYGQKIESSGPLFETMTARDGTLRLRFSHAAGLAAKEGAKLRGFAIAGDDRKWVWADARIEGQEVVLSSPEVKTPTAARYNWADNPNGNLVNGAALPAVPFRTDVPQNVP